MTQVQKLQAILIERIPLIQNAEILKALKVLTDDKMEDVYHLRDWEIKLINKADEEVALGEVISNDEVFAQTDKWLKEREKK